MIDVLNSQVTALISSKEFYRSVIRSAHHSSSTSDDSEKLKSSKQPNERLFAQENVMSRKLLHKGAQRRRNGRSSFRTDSELMSKHLERIRTAGTEGSINFIDPCRVFFGNLDLSSKSEDLRDFVADHHGLPASFLIVDAEVITDWRTGQSKGYGFVRYTESVYATNALSTCNGKLWNGRRLSVKPAINASKQKEVKRQRELYEQRKMKRELAIRNGEEIKPLAKPDSLIPTDPRGAAFLRALDPGLVSAASNCTKKDDNSNLPMKNRQQRRKEERLKPKTKLVSKGFGA
jgi:RNA recognition motif-containing protein